MKWSGAKPGYRALDVCCGSGDLALMLAEAVGPSGQVGGGASVGGGAGEGGESSRTFRAGKSNYIS